MGFSVSAVIPVHNRRESVLLALESIYQQTLQPKDIWVVDDGSTDGTTSAIMSHFPNVQLIQQANHGVSHARNQGIRRATGDCIALLDSDDTWYPQKLATQLSQWQPLRDGRISHTDEHWLRNGKRVNPMDKHRKQGGDIYLACLPLCAMSPSTAIVMKSVFEEIGLFDETLPACEDYDFWLRYCAYEPVHYVDTALTLKTGGHADQLSRRYPAMDTYRLQALAKQIRDKRLSTKYRQHTIEMFNTKYAIVTNGAKKRGREDLVAELSHTYQDILDLPTS